MKTGKRVSFLLAAIMSIHMFLFGAVGYAASTTVYWGDAETGVYENLQDTILMYKNELYDGGYSLDQQQVTKDKKQADFVINTYGEMGAAGIMKVEEELYDPTEISSGTGWSTSVKLELGGVYLVSLHDASYAKIRIDRMNATKVIFSYAREMAGYEPEPSDESYEPSYHSITLEEGSVLLTWKQGEGEAAWDLYRSDSGNEYVRLNDFLLEKPEFTDEFAIAGHTYSYVYVAYDVNGEGLYESDPLEVVVVDKGTLDHYDTAPTQIVMQLDNHQASINGAPYTLEVAPALLSGTTMVPVRFVSEALGADVAWEGSERRITITLGYDTVTLWVDEVEAEVNGVPVYMTVPAQIKDGTTLVPVRFVSENLDNAVEFINETKEIIITANAWAGSYDEPYMPYEPEDPVSYDPEEPAVELDYFYKTWQLEIPGVAYESSGNLVTSAGVTSGGLKINADGTYLWNSTWDGRLIQGTWEENDDAFYPIRLLNAEEGLNWVVGQNHDGDGIFVWDENSIYYEGYPVQ